MTKQTVLTLLNLAATLFLQRSNAQSAFQNLDFESAVVVSAGSADPKEVQFVPAFPGWTGFIGTNQSPTAFYNEGALDSSRIIIIDSGWSAWPGAFGITGPIEGGFTALLEAGVTGSDLQPADTSLSQTGIVPMDAKSLLFKASLSGGPLRLSVSLGGQSLTYTAISNGPSYTLFAADVHQWAGQNAELDFTVISQRPHVYDEYAFLDSIAFSPSMIPEPGGAALVVVGLAAMAVCRKAKRKVQSLKFGILSSKFKA